MRPVALERKDRRRRKTALGGEALHGRFSLCSLPILVAPEDSYYERCRPGGAGVRRSQTESVDEGVRAIRQLLRRLNVRDLAVLGAGAQVLRKCRCHLLSLRGVD